MQSTSYSSYHLYKFKRKPETTHYFNIRQPSYNTFSSDTISYELINLKKTIFPMFSQPMYVRGMTRFIILFAFLCCRKTD